MFSYFRKGRSESKTFIEDKVKWFHFMKGFNDLFTNIHYIIFLKDILIIILNKENMLNRLSTSINYANVVVRILIKD